MKKEEFKMPITDDHRFFEYPDDLSEQLTESGDLEDEDNPYEDYQ